jgi:hypothetical protein
MSPVNNRVLLATVGGVLHSILLNWWEFSYLGGSGPGPRTTLLTQLELGRTGLSVHSSSVLSQSTCT